MPESNNGESIFNSVTHGWAMWLWRGDLGDSEATFWGFFSSRIFLLSSLILFRCSDFHFDLNARCGFGYLATLKMASWTRFAEGMQRVIKGMVNLDDFLPLCGDSRALPAGPVHGRASPACAVHGASFRVLPLRNSSRVSFSGVLYGDSMASSARAMHGESWASAGVMNGDST